MSSGDDLYFSVFAKVKYKNIIQAFMMGMGVGGGLGVSSGDAG